MRSPRRRRRPGRVVLDSIAELMAAVGILAIGFVVWQLWWTDITGGAAQAAAVTQMHHELSAPAAAIAPRRDGEPPSDWDHEHADGDALGIIHVPGFNNGDGSDWQRVFYEGIEKREILDALGVGHYPMTQMPGEVGNFATAAHRTTFGHPYGDVDLLSEGDPIVVESDHYWYVYRVTSHTIVTPDHVEEVAPVIGDLTWAQPPTERMLTMTSCHPKTLSKQRYVVHAAFDYWAEKSDGIPAELDGLTRPKEA